MAIRTLTRTTLTTLILILGLIFQAGLRNTVAVGLSTSTSSTPAVDEDDGFYHESTSTTTPEPTYPDGVNTIPGDADIHYPVYEGIFKTSFSCAGRIAGFYADIEARCQIWHICDIDGRMQSFICTNGTIFSQDTRVCEWWYNTNCEANHVKRNYEQNKDLYQPYSTNSEEEEFQDKQQKGLQPGRTSQSQAQLPTPASPPPTEPFYDFSQPFQKTFKGQNVQRLEDSTDQKFFLKQQNKLQPSYEFRAEAQGKSIEEPPNQRQISHQETTNQRRVPPDETSNQSRVPPDETSNQRRVPPYERSNQRRVPLEEISNQRRVPLEDTSNQRRVPLEDTSNQRRVPLEDTSNQRRVPPEETSNQRRVPLEETPNQRRVPLEETSNQRRGPLEETSNQRRVPLEETSNQRRGPLEETSNQIRVPLEDTSNQRRVPPEETSNQRRVPLEETSNQRRGPLEETSNQRRVPLEEKSNQRQVPLEETTDHVQVEQERIYPRRPIQLETTQRSQNNAPTNQENGRNGATNQRKFETNNQRIQIQPIAKEGVFGGQNERSNEQQTAEQQQLTREQLEKRRQAARDEFYSVPARVHQENRIKQQRLQTQERSEEPRSAIPRVQSTLPPQQSHQLQPQTQNPETGPTQSSHSLKFRHSTPRKHNVKFRHTSDERQIPEETQQTVYPFYSPLELQSNFGFVKTLEELTLRTTAQSLPSPTTFINSYLPTTNEQPVDLRPTPPDIKPPPPETTPAPPRNRTRKLKRRPMKKEERNMKVTSLPNLTYQPPPPLEITESPSIASTVTKTNEVESHNEYTQRHASKLQKQLMNPSATRIVVKKKLRTQFKKELTDANVNEFPGNPHLEQTVEDPFNQGHAARKRCAVIGTGNTFKVFC